MSATSATGSGGSFWGKGFASAALASFLVIVPDRPSSGRVLEKCGSVELDRVVSDDDVEEIVFRLAT